MSDDAATLAFYAREAGAYASRPRKTNSPELTAFLARLTPGGHVADLGCGGGQDALAIKNAGFQVTAIDGAQELAAEAEKRLGQAVRVQRFADLDDDEAFDAIWANASLLHVPRPGLPQILGRVHRALKTGGWLYASFKTGGAKGRDALGRYYNHPSKDELVHLLAAPAWAVEQISESQGAGYDGVVTGWLAVTARKRLPLVNFGVAR